MQQIETPQIPLSGKRPQAIVYALAEAMKAHDKPFALHIKQGDRLELTAAMDMLAQKRGISGPVFIHPKDSAAFVTHLTAKRRELLVILDSEMLSHDQQQFILERWTPPRATGNAHHYPAGLLLVIGQDPGELCTQRIWTDSFTAHKHYTIRWDSPDKRLDELKLVLATCIRAAAVEERITLGERVHPEALTVYGRMQRYLVEHSRRAEARGMRLRPHTTLEEVYFSARDMVRYIGNKPERVIDRTVVEALVFKGVTEASLRQTFGIAERRRKSRPSFGPDAPYAKATGSD